VTDEELASQLVGLLSDLRPASRFHLETALAAARTEGVAGTLVINLPRKTSDLIDVKFVGGETRLILDV